MNRILTFSMAAAVGLAGCGTTAPADVPTLVDAMTPGIFLDEGERAVLPAGVSLRAVSTHGMEVTKQAEGFRSRLYDDVAGYCSIAYGHLIKKRRCDGSEAADFLVGVTEPRATELLTSDMTRAQLTVMTSVRIALSESQYAALCDFVYNVGSTNFKSSALLRDVNAGRIDQVPAQLRRWVMAGGVVVNGLKNRREHEIALFFEGLPVLRDAAPAGADLPPIDIRTGR